MLGKDFLAPYRKAGDPFKSLLARSTYLGKYKRPEDASWTDTIARVVLGSVIKDVTETEAHELFDLFWSGAALPPGRGLWTGGVPGLPVEARNSCYFAQLKTFEDWCWVADMLMCGGGVGVGLQDLSGLPRPKKGNSRLHVLCSRSHPNVAECLPDDYVPTRGLSVLVLDTRQGWIEALREVLRAAFFNLNVTINVSSVRHRGSLLKTFGGIACGPGPLVSLLRAVWSIIRGAQGRRLTSVECLDITNHIGLCVKSGNVRRSALIVLGHAHDQEFRNAKKDWGAVQNHRHSSNNSILLEEEEQIDEFDWRALVRDNAEYGEPGVLNLWKIRQTDPGAVGVNPCGEQPLHHKEACNLSEVYPALFRPNADARRIFQLVTRYTLRQRLQPMTDKTADEVRKSNMRIGVGLGGVCDFDWNKVDLINFYCYVRCEADRYAKELEVASPIACTTVKPSGTISLLNGSSPGIHAPFASYYIRRTRISQDEPMAQALLEAGVPHEPCVYDSTGRMLVFSFPMASKADITVQNQTVKDQIERQVVVQGSWSDNAVSSTVSFAEEESEELAGLLRRYAKDLKSISCLPKKHGYAQPPYEEIDRDTYVRMVASIEHSHPLTSGGDLDTIECEGGACPIR